MISSAEYVRKLAKDQPPSMAYEESMELEVWKRNARPILKELLGLPLTECDDAFQILNEHRCDGYTRYEFSFQSEPGYFVPCNILVPLDVREARPTAICLQGHSTGMHISLGTENFPGDEKTIAGGRDFAMQAVQAGFCAVTMEMRYMGTCGQSPDGTPSCLADNTAMSALLLGRTAIGERVWDIMKLIDVLEKHWTQYVDVSRILCMGNSGGGTAAFYASCIDERISVSVPSCSVCTYEESIMAMYHCPCNFIPGVRRYFNMGDLGCLIVPRPIVVVCGLKDEIFPISGVKRSFEIMKRAYRSVGKESLCRLVIGSEGHQFYPDETWPVIKELMRLEK